MKNKLISIIMMSALAFQLVACGSAETAKTEGVEVEKVTETQAPEENSSEEENTEAVEESAEEVSIEEEVTEETSQEGETQDQAYDFEGQYYAGRGNLSITDVGDGNFLIEVWWGSSASEHSEWVMNGKYDESAKTITYSDCVKHDYTLKENGEVESDVTAYTDGTGSILIVDDSTINWTDDQDHIADDVPMTR